MGRTEASKGLAPPAVRKEQRAKHAKATINQVIPKILVSSTRARAGVETALLVVDPPKGGHNLGSANFKAQKKAVPRQRDAGRLKPKLLMTDTISAAALLEKVGVGPPAKTNDTNSKIGKVGILNMASPLRPGAGVLNGAQAQEEFLCLRTTLLPSLKEEYYRLPEIGGILTKDVLVFRDGEGRDLFRSDRFFVDVVSAGMLRFPEVYQYVIKQGQGETPNVEISRHTIEECQGQIDTNAGGVLLHGSSAGSAFRGSESTKDQSFRELAGEDKSSSSNTDSEQPDDGFRTAYTHVKDRELVIQKMRAVLRVFQSSGATRLVLGAWGCGAYGNPVEEIAQAWKRVLVGTKKKPECWAGIEQVVFAINEAKMAEAFQREFGEDLEKEILHAEASEDDSLEQSDEAHELTAKIAEMELQRSQIRNPESQARVDKILNGLNEALKNQSRYEDKM